MDDDEGAADGGLQTREMKKKMAGPGNGDNVGDVVVEELLKAAAAAAAAAAEEQEDKSVFFDPAKGNSSTYCLHYIHCFHLVSSPCICSQSVSPSWRFDLVSSIACLLSLHLLVPSNSMLFFFSS